MTDLEEELVDQLKLIAEYRAHGTVFCFEVSSYDRGDPDSGWILEIYDRDGNPYQIVKCIRV